MCCSNNIFEIFLESFWWDFMDCVLQGCSGGMILEISVEGVCENDLGKSTCVCYVFR